MDFFYLMVYSFLVPSTKNKEKLSEKKHPLVRILSLNKYVQHTRGLVHKFGIICRMNCMDYVENYEIVLWFFFN